VDPTFANGGLAMRNVEAPFNVPTASAALDTDGAVLVIAAEKATSGAQASRFAITRFTPNGQVDTNFGSNGVASVEFSDAALTFLPTAKPTHDHRMKNGLSAAPSRARTAIVA
jgi:hypothetical protein